MKKISLIGASGSIGKQSIDVIKNNPEDFKLVAFSVGKNIDYANEILSMFDSIKIVCVQNKEDVSKINFDNVVYGNEGLVDIALEDSDVLITAVVGSIGLIPTIKAIETKKDIALANKETLVMAGDIIMPLIKEHDVNIFPVDSEHSAIFQCLNGENPKEINKLIITASGGSFRDKTLKDLEGVSKDDALNHPNWSMGAKITIDSATMFNKGLEVIEAHHLFDIDYENIDVLIHKESIVHSMVEFNDFSTMAQLSLPDMRLPIQYALTYPNRLEINNYKSLDLADIGKLSFDKVDFIRFEALALAYEAGKKGHTYPTVLNAANEKAVELFLNDKIEFLDIIKIVKKYLLNHKVVNNPTLEDLLKVDRDIRNEINKEYECQ